MCRTACIGVYTSVGPCLFPQIRKACWGQKTLRMLLADGRLLFCCSHTNSSSPQSMNSPWSQDRLQQLWSRRIPLGDKTTRYHITTILYTLSACFSKRASPLCIAAPLLTFPLILLSLVSPSAILAPTTAGEKTPNFDTFPMRSSPPRLVLDIYGKTSRGAAVPDTC